MQKKREQEAMPDRSLFVKNTAYQYGLQAAKYLFPFITIVFLTRTLGVDAFAVRVYVLAAMEFMLVFLDYGFLPYGAAAIARAEDDIDTQNKETSAITVLRLILCVLGGIALIPICLAIPLLANNLVYVAIAYVGTCFKALLPDFVFQGREDMGIMTTRFVAAQVLSIVLLIAFVHKPSDLIMVAVIETAANLLALVWSWVNVVRTQGLSFVSTTTDMLRRVFVDSSVFFVASAATTLFTTLTTLFIGFFITDTAQISYWSIAMTAIVAVQALYAPITNSLYPHMIKRSDFALLKRLLVIGVPVVAVGTILFAVLSDVIMLILGGAEYLPGSYVIALVAPILVFSFPAVMLGYPVLAAVGWVKELTATSVIAGLFHIAGMIVLVALNAFTIESVAILRCVTEAVLLLGRVYFVRKFALTRKGE